MTNADKFRYRRIWWRTKSRLQDAAFSSGIVISLALVFLLGIIVECRWFILACFVFYFIITRGYL